MKDLQRTVLRQLQAKMMLNPYLVNDHYSWKEVDSADLPPFSPKDFYHCHVGQTDEYVPLFSEPVLTAPWHPERILGNLGTIGEGLPAGHFEASHNHHVHFYWPMMMYVVTGGNHSIAQGILRGEGKVKIKDLYDFSPLVDKVRFDGEYWVSAISDNKLKAPRFLEIGWAWELGRIIALNSEMPHQITNPRQ